MKNKYQNGSASARYIAQTERDGFALVALIVSLAIIAIVVLYFLNPVGKNNSFLDTSKNSENQVNISNQKLQDYQTEINKQQQTIDVQNDINSIQ